MRYTSALRYSLIHAITSIGIGITVLLVATRSGSRPLDDWVGTIEILVRTIKRYPHNLYEIAAILAVLIVPIRAGFADARSNEPQSASNVSRQAFAAALAALATPLVYLGFSTILNHALSSNFPGHRWNHVEALAMGLWSFMTIPVTLMTSHVLRGQRAKAVAGAKPE
ncbi:hypothetical protein GB928_004670 [Shinella curvata]|uniref:Uncharacterized protein n=1 Tax=Shinella curvata TaxID=1817964 RepID=A0ABT8XB22_9HYPH|nr:hypothetical protein [Shinella curvata]MCJ8055133.1 hypothetical protein [Shinella curvata]MDO6120471.1 hypothetical protein [Shinella curvata]